MKVIQICGTNGTGKTTLVKSLLGAGSFLRMEVLIDGEPKEWWYDGHTAVIGKYAGNNCCGVDAGNYSGRELINTIACLIKAYNPETILYEGLVFCKLFSFTHEAKHLSEKYGYEFCMVVLTAGLKTIAERVIKRSGNAAVDFDRMCSIQKQNIRNAKKMREAGADVTLIDTDKKSRVGVLAALKSIINGGRRSLNETD